MLTSEWKYSIGVLDVCPWSSKKQKTNQKTQRVAKVKMSNKKYLYKNHRSSYVRLGNKIGRAAVVGRKFRGIMELISCLCNAQCACKDKSLTKSDSERNSVVPICVDRT